MIVLDKNPQPQSGAKGDLAGALLERIDKRTARVGIVGMGYVGLPLAVATHRAGFRVLGFDLDPAKVDSLNAGRSYIGRISGGELEAMRAGARFEATGDEAALGLCDILVICVPTPLNKYREPDLSFVENSTRMIGEQLRPGRLVCLESTTYPGTTREVVKPILERGGLVSGKDFFLAFSPEREDPGNEQYDTASIPKVVGGDGRQAGDLAAKFYGAVVSSVVTVATSDVAEAVKLTENIFRSVNIALVNELKAIYGEMGINIWDVIDAAKTKPFGFMAFYPGPGLGGHCIPIDPFYLAWKAREYDVPTRFIELAGEINSLQPRRVVDALVKALGDRLARSINGSRILLIGLAYKKNVEDVRESPAFALIDLITSRGGAVDYYDPHVPVIPPTRDHGELAGKASVSWDTSAFSSYDAALVCTDHDGIDWPALVRAVPLVVDTRNALRDVREHDKVVRA